LPGPCSTCRDPWLQYYSERNAGWIKRDVCSTDGVAADSDDDEEYMSKADSQAPRVIHQAKSED
jgi:hypothetical protein